MESKNNSNVPKYVNNIVIISKKGENGEAILNLAFVYGQPRIQADVKGNVTTTINTVCGETNSFVMSKETLRMLRDIIDKNLREDEDGITDITGYYK